MSRLPDLEALADSAVERFKADLARVITRLTAYLQEHAEQLKADGDGLLEGSESNVELAGKLAQDLAGVLQELGYDEAIGALLDDLEEAQEAISVGTADTLGVSFTSASHSTLQAFATGLVDDLISVKGDAAKTLRETLLVGIHTNLPKEKEILDVANQVGITLRQAISLVDTSMMAFQRESLISQAEEAGIDLFVYTGPDDRLTRPFCAAHVDRIYTAGDLDSEDNGQGLEPTSRYLGGYNCRHYLSPITVEQAQKMVEGNPDVIGGDEAAAILGGRVGPREAEFVERMRGAVIRRNGRQKVVRRRAA